MRGRREGPQMIFFGGDDRREMWTWDCRLPHGRGVRAFGDVPTWADAVRELREHHRLWHGRRGRHGCPRCGAPVQNRAGDPERTDLCPPCTAALFQPELERLRAANADLRAAARDDDVCIAHGTVHPCRHCAAVSQRW